MSTWDNHDEDDILDCIEEACRNSYDLVENFHKKDRVHENSVDIYCQKTDEKVNFQAKFKPGKKDIEQLKKFSKSAADKRIYVYIEQPSRPFKERMTKLESLIDFWDDKKLHEFLLENHSQLYIRFTFLGCRLVKDIREVLFKIFSYSKLDPMHLEYSMLDDWWDFKDRAVKLHSSLEHTELLWTNRLLSQKGHDAIVLEELLDDILLSFSVIARTCSDDLLNLINRIAGKQPNVLSYYVGQVLVSSPWMGMARLKNEIADSVKARKTIDNWILATASGGSEYSLICYYLRDLHKVGEAIEDGVDFVFKDFEKRAPH